MGKLWDLNLRCLVVNLLFICHLTFICAILLIKLDLTQFWVKLVFLNLASVNILTFSMSDYPFGKKANFPSDHSGTCHLYGSQFDYGFLLYWLDCSYYTIVLSNVLFLCSGHTWLFKWGIGYIWQHKETELTCFLANA